MQQYGEMHQINYVNKFNYINIVLEDICVWLKFLFSLLMVLFAFIKWLVINKELNYFENNIMVSGPEHFTGEIYIQD